MHKNLEKIAILGASRGLGLAFAKHCMHQNPSPQLFLASRNIKKAWEASKLPENMGIQTFDFSQMDQLDSLAKELFLFSASRIFYIAGGGPFGPFASKSWKDHQWAIHVNLLFPARLLHLILQQQELLQGLQQMVFVGSAIAEDQADPNSASYALSKHGLKGLISSVQKEHVNLDLRLFSPGYIDTSLLPPKSWPRNYQNSIHQPTEVAKILYNWTQDPQFKNQQLKLDPFSNPINYV